jgi:Tol biopolymer transport system component/DNA-binding winged helix-turn-helix (wHTH) protein
MNERPTLLKPVGPASLADEADFQLGGISVRPSLREVEAAGLRETLEPRVMQVLVALARANGAVVSRDELIRQCWGGRIVGEDAINRTVSKIRQLAELGGSNAFEIETIPRVGYRLRRREAAAAAPGLASAALSGESRIAQGALPHAAVAPAAGLQGSRSWRWIALAAAGIAAAAVLAAGLYFWLRPAPKWLVAESHLPFISTPLIERYPAIAPDGSMIAYSAGRFITDRQIFLRLLKGGDPIQLTHDAGDASAPSWSPDGKAIAYVLFQSKHPCRIMEIPVPAGQPRQIGQCRISERSSVAFAPSGHTLFFSDAPADGIGSRIFKLDLDNGRVSVVTHSEGVVVSDDSPSVSPSGDALLYYRSLGGTTSEVRSLSLADGADRRIAAFAIGDPSQTWSTDGQTIFLAYSNGNENSLWAYPKRGGAPQRIISTGEYIGRLSAGPNGLLALEMRYPGGQLVAVTPHSDQPPRPLDTSGLKTWCVDYSPDGTFLATGWRLNSWGIWISGKDGTLHQLVPLPGPACAIRWSPDGSRFAFIIPAGHGFDVPVMTRSGEPVARLHFDAEDSGVIDWAAGGKSILTAHQDAKGWRIWRTELANPTKSVPITPYGWMNPRVHGTMLFAEKDGLAGIWRIDGTTPTRVTDAPLPEAVDVYTIAGNRLVFADTTDPNNPSFSSVSINGGPKERLGPLQQGQVDFTFGVDPKSGAIVYTQYADDTDIGLLRLERR